MPFFLGDKKVKLYLGDTPVISGEPTFIENRIQHNTYQFGTRTVFDTQKDFDIIACFYMGNISDISRTRFVMFGACDKYADGIPSIEFLPHNTGEDTMALGIKTHDSEQSSSWNYYEYFDSNVIENSLNYYKVSYNATTQIITLLHSVDGESYTEIYHKDLSSNDGNAQCSSSGIAFGGINDSSDHYFPQDTALCLRLTKCKVISEGTVVFGF